MVVVLNNQFLHLLDAVLVSGGVLAHDGDEGNLSPDGEAQLVTGIVEVLRVLIVGQTDGVGAQLLDDAGIVIVIVSGQSVAAVDEVLVTGDTAQGSQDAVEEEAFLRIAGEGADTGTDLDLVVGLVAALQLGNHGVQVGIVEVPQHGVGNEDHGLGGIGRTDGVAYLVALFVIDTVLNGEVLIDVLGEGLDLEGSAAAVAGLGSDHDAGAAVVLQIEVGVGHADDVHVTVQSAVEGEVGVLGIGVVVGCVGDGNNQQVLALSLAQVGDVCTEGGVAALVVDDLLAVQVDGSLGVGTHKLHEDTAAGQGLHRGLEGLGVPALAPVVAAVAVVAVHSVPGVGQIHGGPFSGISGRQAGIFPDEFPVFVDVDDISHNDNLPNLNFDPIIIPSDGKKRYVQKGTFCT